MIVSLILLYGLQVLKFLINEVVFLVGEKQLSQFLLGDMIPCS